MHNGNSIFNHFNITHSHAFFRSQAFIETVAFLYQTNNKNTHWTSNFNEVQLNGYTHKKDDEREQSNSKMCNIQYKVQEEAGIQISNWLLSMISVMSRMVSYGAHHSHSKTSENKIEFHIWICNAMTYFSCSTGTQWIYHIIVSISTVLCEGPTWKWNLFLRARTKLGFEF